MRNIKLILSYDGTDFHGWQSQPGLRTVQSVLETAIEEITRERSTASVCGRTDAGVHALGQVVHFLTPSRHPPSVFVRGLNAVLPRDVRVLSAEDMPSTFHASLDARSKRYRYVIDNSSIGDPFQLRYAWHLPHRLDDAAMQRAGLALLGTHDFRSFETEWPNRVSSVRTLFDLVVRRESEQVWIEVEADGFLYNMVRAIAGTLAWVGSGRRPESWVAQALHAQTRVEAGPTAPPQGLFLLRVHYHETPQGQ